MLKKIFQILFIICLAFWAGCDSDDATPDLAEIYNRPAMYEGTHRNPMILIPAIGGTKLVDPQSGRVVWGTFSGEYANPQEPEGAALLALPMQEGVAVNEIRDGNVPEGAIVRFVAEVFFGLFSIKQESYYFILSALGIGGYRDSQLSKMGIVDYGGAHFTCFQFAYDWRLDNAENAKRLHEFILEKRAYVQAEYEKRFGLSEYNVKFDIVAHSMGGLIARYYLRYGAADLPSDSTSPPLTWEGARYVERAVLVGTPNAGSANALIELVNGREFHTLLPKYPPALFGTLPSVYQLLPRGRHGVLVEAADPSKRIENIFDPALWEKMKWGLADPNQAEVLEWILPEVENPVERRRIARDHLRKCLQRAEQFAKAMDTPASSPDSLSLYLFAGDAVPTAAVLAVNTDDGTLTVLRYAPGDGTVTRSNAMLDERQGREWSPKLDSPIQWEDVVLIFSKHGELTQDPAFVDNLLYLLLEKPD